MQVKEIIEEIDPDYIRCWYCGRIRHKSTMITRHKVDGSLECINENECHEVFLDTKRYLLNERERNN